MRYGKIIKNYIYNTLYQGLLILAPLITMPYVSRVLGVSNLGLYNYVQSIATYFVLIGAVGTTLYGQREVAYLQDDKISRSNAFWEIELIRILGTIICAIAYFFIFCINGKYSSIYLLFMVEVLANAVDISWLYMGLENFKIIVIRNTFIKLLGIVGVFAFAKSTQDIELYVLCMNVPILFGNISLWFTARDYIEPITNKHAVVIGIKKRIKPVFVLFLPQIAVDIYTILDKTMIGMMVDDISQVGYYSNAQKIIKIILTIVTSLGVVMLPAMSAFFAKGDNKKIEESIRTAFNFIYLLGYAMLFGVCSIASRFVPIYFGSGYEPVIPLMIVISPIIVIIATSNVIGRQYLIPTNQQRKFTISVLAGVGTNILLNAFLIPCWGALGASIATVAAELVVTIVQCWYVRKELKIILLLMSGLKYLIMGMVMLIGVLQFGKTLQFPNITSLVIMISLGAVIYLGELIVTKDKMLGAVLKWIQKKKRPQTNTGE